MSTTNHRAKLAEDRRAHSEAVESQLREWDKRLDHLGETVDDLYGSSRERAQDEVRDARRQRDAVARQAAEAREASDDRWRELRDDIAAQFEKLEQKADAVGEKLRAKKE